jgi:cytochrome c6
MKKGVIAAITFIAVGSFAAIGLADTKIDGVKEFKKHCAVCHPNGGNIINPKKPLDAKSMAANNVKTANDIIKTIRDPGPGMNKFDAKTISDKEAKAIADYILKTFK